MLKRVSRLASFLSGFWRDETSQMTKVGVLGVASTLTVLAIAAMPQTAAATGCIMCPNCDTTPCTYDRYCINPPNCAAYHVNCVSSPPYGHTLICVGGASYCMDCTQG